MSGSVLIDTGPLVAISSAPDVHHARCVAVLDEVPPPLLTCWPVVTEAAWLLRQRPDTVQKLLRGFEAGLFRMLALDDAAPRWIADFLKQYRNVPASVADAALVYLANRESIGTIFTLDSDFLVYRFKRNRPFRLLPARD